MVEDGEDDRVDVNTALAPSQRFRPNRGAYVIGSVLRDFACNEEISLRGQCVIRYCMCIGLVDASGIMKDMVGNTTLAYRLQDSAQNAVRSCPDSILADGEVLLLLDLLHGFQG